MAVTRSKRVVLVYTDNTSDSDASIVSTATSSTTSVVLSPSKITGQLKSKITKVVSKPKSPTKLNRTKSAKPTLEEYLASQITDVYEGTLPEDFVSYHRPEFIDGCHHILKIDPSLYPAMIHSKFTQFSNVKCDPQEPSEIIRSYWYSLLSSIIAQQISGFAAEAIEGKFKALFGDEIPTPELTLKLTHEQLQAAGLSNQKAKYIQHISHQFTQDCNLTSVEFYSTASVEELTAELTKLNGIGEWSAKMFILFTLKNLDVFAYEDLGVARGMAKYLARRPTILKEIKLLSHSEKVKKALTRKPKFASKDNSKRDWVPIHDEYVKLVGDLYKPYKSVFNLLLWRISSTNINILESAGIRYADKPNPIVKSE